ncbi:MAG TPA: sensor histidine kinase [Desulfovibrio sp.]|nr:sensor histidine kinase [Desulfovibrio sp.]
MSSDSQTPWHSRLVARLAIIHALFFCVSALAFSLAVYGYMQRTLEGRDMDIAREALRQFTAVKEATDEERYDAALEIINLIGSRRLIVRLVTPQSDEMLPSPEDWTEFLSVMDATPADMVGRNLIVEGVVSGVELRLVTGRLDDGTIVQVGHRDFTSRTTLTMLGRAAALCFLPGIVLALLAGAAATRTSLLGVSRVREAALRIYRGDLTARVQRTGNGDEVDLLAATFNLMLSRIDSLIENMRRMLDNVAHDLRTPLTRLRTQAEMTLLKGASVEECRDLLARQLSEYDRLVQMVGMVLDLSEAESGTMQLRRTSFPMRDLLEEVEEFFTPLAEGEGIALSVACPKSLQMEADRERLRLVLLNMLDNAFRFTPGGSVRVEGAATVGGVVIAVSDTGVGIAPEHLARVFDKLFRVGRGDRPSGHGLGLSLCKAIVEQHGGSIDVASTPGEGTVFSIFLPQH